MSREHDQASAFEQAERDRNIHKVRSAKPAVEATGECLSCATKIKQPLRWCDSACRDDWQKRNPGA